MQYIIDGYNLLFRVRTSKHTLADQRDAILKNLELKSRKIGIDVVIVFDAQFQEDATSKSHLGVLEIIFTKTGETADDKILRLIKAYPDPQKVTVVTSDRQLASYSRKRLAQTLTVEAFIRLIQSRYQNKINPKKTKASTTQNYLDIFESRLNELKESSKVLRESDQDRWLRIFEARLKEHGA